MIRENVKEYIAFSKFELVEIDKIKKCEKRVVAHTGWMASIPCRRQK